MKSKRKHRVTEALFGLIVSVLEKKDASIACKLFSFFFLNQYFSINVCPGWCHKIWLSVADLLFRAFPPPQLCLVSIFLNETMLRQSAAFSSRVFISLFGCVESLENSGCVPKSQLFCPTDGPIVCLCVCVFTTGLTLPIKFSVPAVNFIGGVVLAGWVCIVCLCAEAQCGDHGLEGQDAPLIQVCSKDFFDYFGNLFDSFLRRHVIIIFS